MQEKIDAKASLEIALFGTFLVHIDDVPLPPVRSRKVQWLLALLVLRHGREVERAWLAATLWPDSLESQALFNLRQTLQNLRRAMGPAEYRLHSPNSRTLALNLEGANVDLIAFDAAIAQADPRSLEQATALYRGPLLEGCLEEWCLPERQQREEAYLNALESLAEAALAEGEPVAAIGSLRKVIATDPLRERAQRGLMRAFAAYGEVATAVQVYRDLRLYLHQNLRAEPDPETTALFEEIREQARLRSRISPAGQIPAPAPSSRQRLPIPLTNLIGREQERAHIRAALQSARLVTLTGPGGVGKTRLAIAVAQEMQNAYAEGACFVELASLTDPDLLPATVAGALGLRAEPRRSLCATLQDYLEAREMLLVLDNCEHLIEACASLTSTLLGAAPQLRVLATSRQTLGLTGEIGRQTPPLPLPDPISSTRLPLDKAWVSLLHEVEAIQLFVERASQASPDFRLTAQNAATVARICHRLDGIPLAIELAAAQTRALSLERLEARLEAGLALLIGGDRTVAARQQTLRATLDWSFALLTDAERALLRRTAVFAGGWNLEAVESVCADAVIEANAVLALLTRLIDQSLVVHQARGDDRGYRLLETIRQYGQERLTEAHEETTLRRRHRDYFLELAEEAVRKLQGPEQIAWMDRLETEHDNLRAALAWSLSQGDTESALRFCGALQQFWAGRGYLDEGRRACAAALALEAGAPPARTKALNTAGQLASMQSDFPAARTYLEEGLALARARGDREGVASLLNNLGNVAHAHGDLTAAQRYFEESLTLEREAGRKEGIARGLNNLGSVHQQRGDLTQAMSCYEQSLAFARELGDQQGVARGLHNLGLLAYVQARYPEARTYFEESLLRLQEIGNPLLIATALCSLGNVCRQTSDYAAAQRFYEQALTIYRERGDRRETARLCNNLGNVAFQQSCHAEARSLFEQGLALSRDIGDTWGIASALNNLGNLHRALNDNAAAAACFTESLTLLREQGERLGIAIVLEAFASLTLTDLDIDESAPDTPKTALPAGIDLPRAVRLWSAAKALRDQMGSPRPPSAEEWHARARVALRHRLGDAAWETAWAEGQALSLEQAIDYALQT